MAIVFLHDQTRDSAAENTNGARLTVNCLSGSTVRVSCGQIEHTTISDSSGKAIFEGLKHGTWEISLVDSDQTKTVEIVTDYAVVIDFFTATIVVDYPEGSICKCTNGIVTYTAPDTSGLWYCVVSDIGTWTVSCTDGIYSKSGTIEVLDEGSYTDIKLSYFTSIINVIYPNGAVCSCSNGDTVYSASDTTGSWSFTVYKAGEWVITATDGIQTVDSAVIISYDGQIENVTIKFFASTIDITYPEGATCVCSDGIITINAPDTSGKWLATVPRTGTWTVRAYIGNSESTQTVAITKDGQRVSVLCEFFIAYIHVSYPAGTFKTVVNYIDSYGSKTEVGIDTSGTGTKLFAVDQKGNYEVSIYRVSPYIGIENEAKDYASKPVVIDADKQTVSVSILYVTVPEFTYTGTYKLVDDLGNDLTETDGDWNIQFLTTGNLRFTKLNGANNGIDVFVLGGGGDGGEAAVNTVHDYVYCAGGGGGAGGYRESAFNTQVGITNPYEIVIGGSNGSSSAFGVSASGGGAGSSGIASGQVGGGEGGTGGSKGGTGGYNAGAGTNGEDGTYAFIGTSGYLYGAGGGGGHGYNSEADAIGPINYGGRDGGGNSGENGVANSGGGGGGENQSAQYTTSGVGKGGSGIVIIRNKR